MFLKQITDSALAQNAYLIGCQRSGEAILIDPERDIDRYLQIASHQDLRVVAVAETHIHADYLSGARELLERHPVTAYLSAEGGPDWQFEWAKGNPNTRFLHDGDEFHIGEITFKALFTPGHTPEHLSFLVTDHGSGADEPLALLSGDFLFVGDVGRPDLLESAAGQVGAMASSAKTLYASLRATSSLPGHLQILPAHGAGSACGKSLGAVPTSVLDYERKFNSAYHGAMAGTEDRFVEDILAGQPEPPLYFARMKRDNRIGPALLPDGKLPSPRRLKATDLSEWIETQGKVVLDLRADRAEFMARHLRGALFAPFAGGKFPVAAGSYVPENTGILLILDDPAQLDEAVRQLVRIGLDLVTGWMTLAEASAAADFQTSIPRIKPAEIPANASVIDVRNANEHASRHLKGAKNIAYTRLAARIDEVPKDETFHVHCAGGLRAAMAAAYLASQGRDVIQVDGAFADFPEALKS